MKKGVLLAVLAVLAITSAGCSLEKEPVLGIDVEQEKEDGSLDAGQTDESELNAEDAMAQMFEALHPGYYIVSSIGRNGDVEFFNSLDSANGYLRLEEDNTGTLMLENEEKELTWEEYTITCDEQNISGYTMSSPESDEMLMLYFADTRVSVIFYQAEE